MTPKELDAFVAKQERMSARIAKKAARGRLIAKSYGHIQDAKGRSLGERIAGAIDRPGVNPTNRPVSEDGRQTFHFAMTSVNRTSSFASRTAGAKTGLSAAHERYIEREGAAETVENDIAREARLQDVQGWLALGGQAYIERPAAAERSDQGRTLASFGNIAEKFEDRLNFWEATERCASMPRSHGLVMNLAKDDRFWAVLAADEEAPSQLREAWAEANDRKKRDDAEASEVGENQQTRNVFIDATKEQALKRDETQKASIRLTDVQALEVHAYLSKRLTRSKRKSDKAACYIEPGRGGRIQNRLIIELPHELSPEARLSLAKEFCHEEFVKGRECALPHWCVIHAPNHHNDPRNTHMHIVYSERPAKRMRSPITGAEVWDFEVLETTYDKFRMKRSRRPFEQKTDRSLNHRSWVRNARAHYAKLANRALKEAGSAKRYDPRRYTEMGIEAEPLKHIAPKEYLKEKQGRTSKTGDATIRAQWIREKEQLEERFGEIKPNEDVVTAFDRELKRWRRNGQPIIVEELTFYRHAYREGSVLRQHHSAEAAANAHILKRIHSKLVPPLATEGPPEILITDFSRMWAKDLIADNRTLAERHSKGENAALIALKTAQSLIPPRDGELIDIGISAWRLRVNHLTAQYAPSSRGSLDTAALYENVSRIARAMRERASEEAERREERNAATVALAIAAEARDAKMRIERTVEQNHGARTATGETSRDPSAPQTADQPQTDTPSPRMVSTEEIVTRAEAKRAQRTRDREPMIVSYFGRTGPVIQKRVVPFDPARSDTGLKPAPEKMPFVPTKRIEVDIRMPRATAADYEFSPPAAPILANEIAAKEQALRQASSPDPLKEPRPEEARENRPTSPSKSADDGDPVSAPMTGQSEPSVPREQRNRLDANATQVSPAPATTTPPSSNHPSISSPAPRPQTRGTDTLFGSTTLNRTATSNPDPNPTPAPSVNAVVPLAQPAAPSQVPSVTVSKTATPKKPKREPTREEIRRRALLARSRGRDIDR